jgi:hypothetical protein
MSARRPIVFWPGRLRADHASLGQAAMHLDAPRCELVGHDLRGALFLEGGFGVAMDVAADGGQVGVIAGQKI